VPMAAAAVLKRLRNSRRFIFLLFSLFMVWSV
jgi:hypothetical protein